jgi:hypothetical protein
MTNELDVTMDPYGLIRLGGRIIGLLVPSDYGTYLCPPIVVDVDGKMVMGHELFALAQRPGGKAGPRWLPDADEPHDQGCGRVQEAAVGCGRRVGRSSGHSDMTFEEFCREVRCRVRRRV